MATTTTGTTVKSSFLRRIIGAAALDAGTYEEIEHDSTATGQAFSVVLLSSLAAGVGASGAGGFTIGKMLYVTTAAVLLWAAWSLVTFEIGRRLMPEPQTRGDVDELLRTIGFASAPGFMRILGVLPGTTSIVFAISSVWMLAAMVVAVRQALDYCSTARAIVVCLFGWFLAVAIALVLGLAFGPTAT